GLEPVGLALQVGGPDRLKGTVENLFGVSLGSVTVLNSDQLVALVRPAGPLRVTIPERVAQVADDGRVQVLFDGGPGVVRPDQVPTLLAARGQSTDLGRLARPQVQILNGTGVLELDVKVAARLVPAGVEVKLTGNAASFDYAETQIVFYDPAKQPVAERIQRALGVGRLVFSRRPLDVVDVTVIVGKDFRSG